MENQVLAEFVRLLKISNNSRIEATLLQYLSIMIQNLDSEHAIYYCFSNDYINNIIIHQFDFDRGDLAQYYVSFLRAVSNKLNSDTICLLVKVHGDAVVSFPLFTEALKFASHEEKMIQTAIRSLALGKYYVSFGYAVCDDMVHQYITTPPVSKYFSDMVLRVRHQCFNLDVLVHASQGTCTHEKRKQLLFQVDKIINDLYYFKDILDVGNSRLSGLVTENLLSLLVFPVLHPLLTSRQSNILNALLKVLASKAPISVLIKWHTGWFLQKLLIVGGNMLDDHNLELFSIAYEQSRQQLEKELDGCWFDSIPDTLRNEWMSCKTASGVPCRIAFSNAGFRNVYAIPVATVISGRLLLVKKHPFRSQRGVVLTMAPLAGLSPKIDEVHPIWLHLRIREFDPKFVSNKKKGYHSNMPSHVADGKWTLGFQDAKACEAARLLILEEIRKQRSNVESLLSPLLHNDILEDVPNGPDGLKSKIIEGQKVNPSYLAGKICFIC
ncbi:hypothetical protein L484_018833 [Morus notabilis]|uniref:FPL domain-containing protein n=1 Tax=Morus notabilis TaxID=981085 RepID=W9RPS8_9ROSA|nr:hypothetical protein L484_018833 [Morus notabilis]